MGVRVSLLTVLAVLLVFCAVIVGQKPSFGEINQLQSPQNPAIGIMIHGGSGSLLKGSLSPKRESRIRAELEKSILAGYRALQDGKSSVEAAEIATRSLEDAFSDPSDAPFIEASIMDGKSLRSGAASGLSRVKNPILLARAAMDKAASTLIVGEAAEKFAAEQKIAMQSPRTGGRNQLEPVFTSVGAIALDKNGNLAAGSSSTGTGTVKDGRVGPSALIGVATYASNSSCAVSAVGTPEHLIGFGVARDLAALMQYNALPVQNAADRIVQQKLKKVGGSAGLIAMDKLGNMAVSFNTESMFRAYIAPDGRPVIEIYK